MNTTQIKTELQRMIEEETDVSILTAIRTILEKTSLDPILKEKLSLRANLSEKDIQEGKVHNKEEVVKRTNR